MTTKTQTRLSVAAALAGAVTLASLAASAQPITQIPANMEKCYGISRAGENLCANQAGTHSCAGQTRDNYSGQDWRLVATGTCTSVGGRTEPFQGTGTPPAAPRQ